MNDESGALERDHIVMFFGELMLIKVYFMADCLEQMRGLNDKFRNSVDSILLYAHYIEKLKNFRFIPRHGF